MKNEEYQNIKADAVLYRHLQLLLVRLDNIFIYPHKVLNSKYAQPDCISVEEFYSEKTQIKVMNKFKLDTEIPNVMRSFVKPSPITYSELIYIYWKDIIHYAHLIFNNQRIYNNTDLFYELDYLINESILAIMLNINGFLSGNNCKDISFLLYTKDAFGNINNDFERHIIQMHHLAFNLYEKIYKYDIDNIHEPMFYRSYKNK